MGAIKVGETTFTRSNQTAQEEARLITKHKLFPGREAVGETQHILQKSAAAQRARLKEGAAKLPTVTLKRPTETCTTEKRTTSTSTGGKQRLLLHGMATIPTRQSITPDVPPTPFRARLEVWRPEPDPAPSPSPSLPALLASLALLRPVTLLSLDANSVLSFFGDFAARVAAACEGQEESIHRR